MILAHGGATPAGWHDVPGAWPTDPVTALAVVAVGLALALARAHRRGAARSDWIAAIGLVAALLTPLDALADRLFSAHMVQHLVLMFVVAPALAVSRPWLVALQRVPSAHARSVLRVRRAIRARAAVGAAIVAVAVLWWWHLPWWYDAAVDHESIHALEHASLLVGWTALWSAVRGAVRRRRAPVALGMLAVVSASGNALGMLLVFTTTRWYDDRGAASFGLSPMADQQLAGALMWIGPGLGLVGLMATIFLRWLSPVRERSAREGDVVVSAAPDASAAGLRVPS